MESYDYTIIGGGIFGVYAAIHLAAKGAKICLVEKEKQLFGKASTVNQARIHSGYHYPRSIATARLSEDNKARFIKDHEPFINKAFSHFYAIDKYSSVTDAAQFERFCEHLDIPCKRVLDYSFFNKNRIEALFQVEEYSFDPVLISAFYQKKLIGLKNVFIKKETEIKKVDPGIDEYEIHLQNADSQFFTKVKTKNVISAAYAGTNGVLDLFGFPQIELTHEIAEMVFVKTNQNIDFGLTVMDGQFCSIMPYGLSGFLSLSSVAYTPHDISKENSPVFDCQSKNLKCSPIFLKNCNDCSVRPKSNFSKMKNQIQGYLNEDTILEYHHSKFTIKSKLKSSHIDDSRPTRITQLSENPGFYCIFAGKINSIYEIEKIL